MATWIERIRCPKCKREQDATVETFGEFPFAAYVHICKCGYCIMESEWEKVESRN